MEGGSQNSWEGRNWVWGQEQCQKSCCRMGRCGWGQNAPDRWHSWCWALACYALYRPGCCRNRVFLLSCSPPESSLRGRVGSSDAQSPTHKARGFPRRRKEEQLLGGPVKWQMAMQHVLPFESYCQIALQEDCTSLSPHQENVRMLFSYSLTILGTLANLVGERWEGVTQAETWRISRD